jgi:hypothetical protein
MTDLLHCLNSLCREFSKINVLGDFFHGCVAPVGLGLLIVEVSRSHSETPHSIGLFWTGDWNVAERSTWQHTKLTKDIHAPVGFETVIPAIQRSQTQALHRATTGIGPREFKYRTKMSKSVTEHLQSDKDSVGLLYKREIRNFPTLIDVHSVRPTCTMYICQRPLIRTISAQTMGKVTSLFSYSLFRRKIL